MAARTLCLILLFCSVLLISAEDATNATEAREGEADPPPKSARLNNDKEYQEQLSTLLKQDDPSLPPQARLYLAYQIKSAAFSARDYETAEKYGRLVLQAMPDDSSNHSSLSVYLGKQGKYKEAEASALEALRLDPSNQHASLVLASWEWHLGKRKKARETFNSLKAPVDPGMQKTYFSCKACFFASVGSEKELEDAIKKRLELGDDKTFFQRDVIFDPYRGKEWFIKLVGETLAKEEQEESVEPPSGK